MSIRITDEYPTRSEGASAGYPDGTFKNETAPGMKNGTPVEVAWAKDVDAFFQFVRAITGVEASNTVDTVITNQNAMSVLAMLSGTVPHAEKPRYICSDLQHYDWADPTATENYLDTTETIRDACLGWDADSSRPYLFIVHDDISISKITGCWYNNAAPVLSSPLSFSWSTTPDEVLAICCDAEYLYVAWRNTSANVKLSKFAINPWTGAETIAGRDTGYQVRPTSGDPGARLCVADANNIGVLLNQNTAPDEHRVRIGVWSKDNASYSSAQFASYKSDYTSCGIVSDGTYLYAPAIDDSSYPVWRNMVLRAEIADPSTQAAAQMPFTFNSTTEYELGIGAIYPVRDMLIIALMDGSLYVYKDNSIPAYPICDALPMTFFDSGGRYGALMASDGMNLHIHLVEDDELGSDGFHSVFKMPIGEFLWNAIEAIPPTYQHRRVRVDAAASLPSTAPMGKLLFDRRDMWLILRTGEVYRICNPGGN